MLILYRNAFLFSLSNCLIYSFRIPFEEIGIFDISNYPADVELPSTGGAGTMLLITIGSLVALAFAVLLITHKKMSVYRD